MRFFYALIYSKDIKVRILRHILYWATDIASYFVVISSNSGLDSTVVYSVFFRIPLVAGLVYLIIYYLIPKYSNAESKNGLFLWVPGILLFIGVGLRYYKYYIINPIIDPLSIVPSDVWSFGKIIGEIFSWMAVICLAIAIKVMKTKAELQQRNEELIAEKRNAELSFLKAQMHPHFLFNTLNTLYSDAIKTSSTSEQIVLRLSNLLRFILEECNKPLIPLQKEIKVIDDYIELEKLRHGDRLQINWNHSIRNPNTMISPLLLLPFVENSFKHTLSSQRGNIPITIHVFADDKNVELKVQNERTPPSGMNGHTPGVGIRNVRKQLELLYDKNFSLKIDSGEQYTVNLKVPATSND